MSIQFPDVWPCPMCGETFDTFEEMDMHANEEADEYMNMVFGQTNGHEEELEA